MKKEFTKLPLLSQQREALRRMWGKAEFALLMEQGTGKTMTFIAEALALYSQGKIDALMVLAPNGVHENWILTEIPQYVPDDVSIVTAYYATDANKREKKALERLMTVRDVGDVPPLRILAMSYDSLLVDRGFKFAESFLRCTNAMIVADESQKIKNLDSRRTRRALNIRKHCKIRRIGTGTMITNSPMDAYSQFEFLKPGLLEEDSITAFRAQYAELLPHGHGLVRHIVERVERSRGRKMSDKEKEAVAPQIIKQDAIGRPIYRNLDKLHELIAKHSYRVLKADCLDLPPKVYQTRFFHLTKAQRVVYDRMAEELRYILEDGTLLTTSKLVAMGKLRQITSGFLLMRDGSISYIDDNPRIELLHSEVEDIAEPGIIWSQYKEEQRNIERMIKSLQMTCETVNGDTPMKRRREIRDEFQAGNLQWINAHPATMGSGFTLTKGQTVFYYSNGFNLEERLQSEDRTHRIGTTGTVLYTDFVAIDTRDDDVVWALQHKLDTAAMIQGDPARESRFSQKGKDE